MLADLTDLTGVFAEAARDARYGAASPPTMGQTQLSDAAVERSDVAAGDALAFRRALPNLARSPDSRGARRHRPSCNLLVRFKKSKDDVLRFLVRFEVKLKTPRRNLINKRHRLSPGLIPVLRRLPGAARSGVCAF